MIILARLSYNPLFCNYFSYFLAFIFTCVCRYFSTTAPIRLTGLGETQVVFQKQTNDNVRKPNLSFLSFHTGSMLSSNERPDATGISTKKK